MIFVYLHTATSAAAAAAAGSLLQHKKSLRFDCLNAPSFRP
jgi:hypothetical protein